MAYLGSKATTMVQFCGNTTLMQLRTTLSNVWTHTVILALRARHHISPRWLEVMRGSLSLSLCASGERHSPSGFIRTVRQHMHSIV